MEEYPYRDQTFKTGTGLYETTPRDDGPEPLRLPEAVNFVALRETCLSEAPFVSKTNRLFWKKWMDSSQYITILAASLKLVMECINDLGSVNTWSLYHLEDNPLMEQMSVCIAEMLIMDRAKYSHSHDTLFRRMPELLCYMIIGSLHSCAGKQGRVYNSVKFREVLLDWLSELVGGMRITNCMKDREWLFMDANEVSVLVTHTSPNHQTAGGTQSNSPTLTGRRGDLTPNDSSSIGSSHSRTPRGLGLFAAASGGLQGSSSLSKLPNLKDAAQRLKFAAAAAGGAQHNQTQGKGDKVSRGTRVARQPGADHDKFTPGSRGAAVSTFSVENSPLVRMYMNLGRSSQDVGYVCAHPCKVLLSHLPQRPLTQMQPEALLLPGQFREKKLPSETLHATMRESAQKRRQILHQFADEKTSLKQDMSRTSEAYKVQLALLNKKPVTQKQLLAAAAATATTTNASALNTDDY